VPTVVRLDYVTRHIIELLCPLALCGTCTVRGEESEAGRGSMAT